MSRDPRFDVLFQPIAIGPKVLRNRFYQVPHSTGFGSERPGMQARFRSTRAEGGWACVNVELCSIDPESDRAPLPVPAQLWDDDDVGNLTLLCNEAHDHGALVGVELWHGGSNVEGSPSRLVPGGPSVLPSDAFPMTYPRELSEREISHLHDRYVEAAERAAAAGFDIVYVYGAHSYLPLQFLSPFYNKRTDRYGGSLGNRARFWLEALEKVRSAVSDRCAVAVRIGIDPEESTGAGIDDVLGFVRMADDLVDIWDVNVSTIGDPWLDMRPSRLAAQGYQFEWTSRVRESTAKPIVGVGRLTSPDEMAKIVSSGAWDVIGAARPSIADPFLPRKIEEGRNDEIRECIGCNVCISRVLGSNHILCTQNPTAGEEYRRGWHPERVPKLEGDLAQAVFLVVGAGAAGLECAVTLAKRGARMVNLVEAKPEPGGYAALLSRLPGLGEWARVVDHRMAHARRLTNLSVTTGTRLGIDDILDHGADVVIVATGAEWVADGLSPMTHSAVPGLQAPMAVTPERVLAKAEVGGVVVVYDCEGYVMGVGVAEYLAMAGRSVHLVTPHAVPGPVLDRTFEGNNARKRLRELGVEVHVETQLLRVERDSAVLRGVDSERVLACETVVPVTARLPRDGLRRELQSNDRVHDSMVRSVYSIGDCIAPRLTADCIFDGHRLALEMAIGGEMHPAPFLRERRLVTAESGMMAV